MQQPRRGQEGDCGGGLQVMCSVVGRGDERMCGGEEDKEAAVEFQDSSKGSAVSAALLLSSALLLSLLSCWRVPGSTSRRAVSLDAGRRSRAAETERYRGRRGAGASCVLCCCAGAVVAYQHHLVTTSSAAAHHPLLHSLQLPAAMSATSDTATVASSPELEVCYRCKERGHRAKVRHQTRSKDQQQLLPVTETFIATHLPSPLLLLCFVRIVLPRSRPDKPLLRLPHLLLSLLLPPPPPPTCAIDVTKQLVTWPRTVLRRRGDLATPKSPRRRPPPLPL